jgi:hypothetical protein
MVSSKLIGGLGNYLFQVSTTYALARRNNDICVFDVNRTLTGHNHITTYKQNIFRNLNFNDVYCNKKYYEPFFHYQEIPYTNGLFLNGYFQSEKYFIDFSEELKDLFSIDDESFSFIKNKYDFDKLKNSCSLHVRRGDYLKYPDRHPICDKTYYSEAIKYVNNKDIFIFSDDIAWCKETLQFNERDIHFIEGNPDYIDLWLMSLCENNIIANSTFSWWGAWLNLNKNKVVVSPVNWFGKNVNYKTEDIYPTDWIKI